MQRSFDAKLRRLKMTIVASEKFPLTDLRRWVGAGLQFLSTVLRLTVVRFCLVLLYTFLFRMRGQGGLATAAGPAALL